MRRDDEIVDDTTPADQRMARDTRFALRLYSERQSLLARLLHAMAEVLKFKVEQLEIFEGGYTPQGWHDIETEQMIVRRLFADIGAGKRIFPIGVFYFPGQPQQTTPQNDGQPEAATGG
jgi:Family of unknown function (DUF6680)